MVKQTRTGYVTRDESVIVARKLRKNPGKEFQLWGILHKSSGRTQMSLMTEKDIVMWGQHPEREQYHVEVLAKRIYWVNHYTQQQLADSIYVTGNNGRLQNILKELEAKHEPQTVAELDELKYPIKTTKGLYIGDPCYVLQGLAWKDFIKQYNEIYETQYKHLNFKGYVIGVSETKYGDGEYLDNQGFVYPVDAGLIGALPLEVVDESLASLGQVIYGKFKANVSYEKGDIIINIAGETEIRIETQVYEFESQDFQLDEEEYPDWENDEWDDDDEWTEDDEWDV